MLTQLLASGIHPGLDKYEAKRVRIVNFISFLCGALVVLYGILFYALSGEAGILYPALLFSPFFFSIILLNKSGLYMAAKVGLQVLFSGIILYYGIMFGSLAEVQLFAVFSICVAMLSFKVQDLKMILACSLLPVACVVLLEVNYSTGLLQPLALPADTQHLFRWLIMSVVFALCVLAIAFHCRSNDQLQKEVEWQNTWLERYNAELESQVKERTAALEKASYEKSRYLSETSHETRNYINAIIGLSDILLQETREVQMPDGARQIIEDIYCNSHDLRGMLTNVLEVSKIEAGQGDELHAEPVSLKRWLQPLTHTYSNIANMSGVRLDVQNNGVLPECIMLDQSRLTRILNNLLSNAIKVTPRGHAVLLTVDAQEGVLSIAVHDSGPGIPPEKRDLLFKPFAQLGLSSDHKGSGLGLVLTRRYAEQLGGTLSVESVTGVGSVFRVRMPLQVCEDVQTGNEELRPSLAGKKVLLIEDEQMNCMILERFLLPLGLEITTCANGLEGISAATAKVPDLIILDMAMPVMDGKETTRILRSLPQFNRVPIIALSSNALLEEQETMLALGADEYIVKPVLRRQITDVVVKHLSKARSGHTMVLAF
ncbi:ATP-binding protein [Chitinophaga horti]|uniref:histidine kinase n=1 Tax=Chitinophaga horti TaxID=2920382 RepID=A0ABY6IYC8_9BACT|nr:ATP-binding protein [Chitinophaga horti]UYQ92385.1 ATP-binding protein [Chitinophaga horti]